MYAVIGGYKMDNYEESSTTTLPEASAALLKRPDIADLRYCFYDKQNKICTK